MIDETVIERVVERVWGALQAGQVGSSSTQATVELEASGRHVHASRADIDAMFGVGYQLTPVAELSQPGQFVCAERVRVIGPKGSFDSVPILGPERVATQVELSVTDARTVGVAPDVRVSGDLAGTPGIELAGPVGRVKVLEGVMVAKRHIHMHPDFAARWGLADRQVVSVKVGGDRGVVFSEVVIRVSDQFATYMHIDYDEANACGFHKGTCGTIIA